MPKIDERSKTIIFDRDDWLTGEDNIRNTGARDFGIGMTDSANIDPYKSYGYLSPALRADLATNNDQLNGNLLNIVTLGLFGYGIENTIGANARIHRIEGLNTGNLVITNSGSYPHSMPSDTYWIRDIITYYIGTVEYVFYSWTSGSEWNVGRLTVGTGTFDDDFMSTVPASPLAAPYLAGGALNVDHPMYVASNNRLYIGDRNFVHSFDGQTGANGTFEANVLDLPQGYQIVDFLEWNNYLVVFANNTSKTFGSQEPTAFFWDTFSESFTFTKSCGGDSVACARIYESTMIISVSGETPIDRKGNERLRVFDGNEFVDFCYYGTRFREGMQVYGNSIYLNTVDGVRVVKRYGDTISSISLNSNNLGESVFVKIFSSIGGVVFSARPSGTTFGLFVMRTSLNPNAFCWTKSVSPYFEEGCRGRIKKVKIYFKEAVSSNSLQLQLSFLDDENLTGFYTVQTFDKRVIEIESNTDLGTPLPLFTRQQLYIEWQQSGNYTRAPEIEKIVMYYEKVNV